MIPAVESAERAKETDKAVCGYSTINNRIQSDNAFCDAALRFE